MYSYRSIQEIALHPQPRGTWLFTHLVLGAYICFLSTWKDTNINHQVQTITLHSELWHILGGCPASRLSSRCIRVQPAQKLSVILCFMILYTFRGCRVNSNNTASPGQSNTPEASWTEMLIMRCEWHRKCLFLPLLTAAPHFQLCERLH